jgi:hypothetical protein
MLTFSDKRFVDTVIPLDRNEPAANMIDGKVTVVIRI